MRKICVAGKVIKMVCFVENDIRDGWRLRDIYGGSCLGGLFWWMHGWMDGVVVVVVLLMENRWVTESMGRGAIYGWGVICECTLSGYSPVSSFEDAVLISTYARPIHMPCL